MVYLKIELHLKVPVSSNTGTLRFLVIQVIAKALWYRVSMLAYHVGDLSSNHGNFNNFAEIFSYKSIFMTKPFEKCKQSRIFPDQKHSDFSRQYKYFQLEKSSDFDKGSFCSEGVIQTEFYLYLENSALSKEMKENKNQSKTLFEILCQPQFMQSSLDHEIHLNRAQFDGFNFSDY